MILITNEISKRKLKVIEAYIIKYQKIMFPENIFEKIIWFINCNSEQLEYWEDKLFNDK